ncbi:MAG TPA: VOC family protein [Candidatus Polarisedimenticolia bacterium]|nr:VOC family protein [Candidatus Polarisedimenticolia bacterium]
MAKPGKPVPEGFHTVTPHLIVKGAAAAIDFYKKAFGAEEIHRMPGPDGSVMHAEIKIGDSRLMINDEFPSYGKLGPKSIGGSPVTLHLYVTDVDALFDRAVKAGAKATMPLADMFWGDRYGQVEDPYGHQWSLGTHKEDLTPEETIARMKAAGF